MLKHIVLFKFKAVSDKTERMQEIKTELEKLTTIIPELQKIRIGLNHNPKEQWDMSLEAEVANMQDLETYANHPAHQQIVKTMIAPIKENRACVDYTF